MSEQEKRPSRWDLEAAHKTARELVATGEMDEDEQYFVERAGAIFADHALRTRGF